MSEIVTAEVLAKRLHVKTETIRDWRRRGLIPALRATGRPLLFELDAVLAAMRERDANSANVECGTSTKTVSMTTNN